MNFYCSAAFIVIPNLNELNRYIVHMIELDSIADSAYEEVIYWICGLWLQKR